MTEPPKRIGTCWLCQQPIVKGMTYTILPDVSAIAHNSCISKVCQHECERKSRGENDE